MGEDGVQDMTTPTSWGGGGGRGDMGKEEFNFHSCNEYRSSLFAVGASRALPLVSLRDLPDGL